MRQIYVLFFILLALTQTADAGKMVTPNNPVAFWVWDVDLQENGTLIAWVDRESMQFIEPDNGVIFQAWPEWERGVQL